MQSLPRYYPDPTGPLYDINKIIQSRWAHFLIFGCCFFGLVWGFINLWRVQSIKLDAANVKSGYENKDSSVADDEKNKKELTNEQRLANMQLATDQIKRGSYIFIVKEYTYLAVFMVFFSICILCMVDLPWKNYNTFIGFPYTTFAFLLGCASSMFVGYIGIEIATYANLKVAFQCNISKNAAFQAAMAGSQAYAFIMPSLAITILEILVLAYRPGIIYYIGHTGTQTQITFQVLILFQFVAGFALGASITSIFSRVGGGIFAKSSDLGTDIAGKICEYIDQDATSHPGTNAINIGTNINDIAGVGADLFGSLIEAMVAALIMSTTSWNLMTHSDAVYFPLVIPSVGIVASFLTLQFVHIPIERVEARFRLQIFIATLIQSGLCVPILWMLPSELKMEFMSHHYQAKYGRVFGCIMLGLWSGFFIGLQTEWLTSNQFDQSKELARACLFDAATNVIKGLALGYQTSVIPLICVAITVCCSLYWAGVYGVALAALGMLGCLPVYLTIDFFGPIVNNAKSIVQIAKTGPSSLEIIDKLNDAGVTTSCVGKSFSNTIALLVSIALFGAYTNRISELSTDGVNPNIMSPFTFSGLLFGAMLPYAYSALIMAAVNQMAEKVIADIKDLTPKIKEGQASDHKTFVESLTVGSFKLVIAPALIIILLPIILGVLFGFRFVSGMIAGTIVAGIQIGIANSNSGGVWCNTSRYVQLGNLERPQEFMKEQNTQTKIVKGDIEYKAALTCASIGTPLKDSAGPSINILIKTIACTALVFGTFIVRYGGHIGGGIYHGRTN